MDINVIGLSGGYDGIVAAVLFNGKAQAPRGLQTTDVSPATITISNPRDRLVLSEWRDMNIAFAITEWLMLMTGDDSVDRIGWYAKNMYQFSSDGKTVDGAYGPRVAPHLGKLIARLSADPHSRHGVVTILKTEDFERPNPPCTISVQARNTHDAGVLHLDWITTMRSNDLIWGFTYDVFFWTMTQEWLALQLGVELGEYSHNVGSLHIYTERDARMLAARSWGLATHLPMPPMIDSSYEAISWLSAVEASARAGLFDHAIAVTETLEPYWQMWACVLIAWSARKWGSVNIAHAAAAQIQFEPLRRLVERRL